MSRQTCAGMATVTLLCATFGLSRQAYYAAQQPAPERAVVRMPRTPRFTAAEVVLAKIKEVLSRDGTRRRGRHRADDRLPATWSVWS